MFTPLLFRAGDLFKRLIREAKKAPLPLLNGQQEPFEGSIQPPHLRVGDTELVCSRSPSRTEMWLCLKTQQRSHLESSGRTLRQMPCTVRRGSDLAKPPRFSEHQFPAEKEASHPRLYPWEAFLPGMHTLSALLRNMKLRS